MIKHLLIWLTASALLFGFRAAGQVDPDSLEYYGCGHNGDYMRTLAVPLSTAALTPPGSFPTSAIVTCGKFKVYYEDMRMSGAAAGGFNDATYGADRRNTMCAVLNYIQSVFDFSNIPPGEYIRFHVDTSYVYGKRSMPTSPPGTAETDRWENNVGTCGPYWKTPFSPGSVINGFVYDYIKLGIDPMPGEYHATLRMNFDQIRRKYEVVKGASSGGTLRPIVYSNGVDTPDNCSYSLYTSLLHLTTHTLGWFSWADTTRTSHVYSIMGATNNFDASLHFVPDPGVTANPFSYMTPYASLPLGIRGMTLVNGSYPPDNYALVGRINSITHLGASLYYLNRVTPGDNYEPVMHYQIFEGDYRPKYHKADVKTLHDAIGLSYNPTYAIDSAVKINNHIPWSSKMNSDAYNMGFDGAGGPEAIAADYTINNDFAAKVVINLNGDTTNHDSDHDSISVMPGSLVNFRGASDGGNNHGRLVLSNSDRTITYYPRHNFYGRCQFGLNLYDGHEKGAFVVYTVDVLPGSNVYTVKGDDMVVNGNFEEGAEVKIRDTGEKINNSFFHRPLLGVSSQNAGAGRLNYGLIFSDGHPYDFRSNFLYGTAVRNSYKECTDSKKGLTFGSPFNSFPWNYTRAERDVIAGDLGKSSVGINYPDVATTGNRYMPMGQNGILFNLADTIKSCRRYVLEFDVRRTFDTGWTYPTTDYVRVGFTNSASVTLPESTPMIAAKRAFPLTGMSTTAWAHQKIVFSYCTVSPTNVMFLSIDGAWANHERSATVLLDNVSLKQEDLALTIKITDSAAGTCTRKLTAGPESYGCPAMTYEWRNEAGVLLGSARTINVSPLDTTKYNVTVSDGCNTGRDTISVKPCRCAPVVVFGKKTITTLGATVTGTLAPGYYSITSDVTVTGTTNFNGAKILIEPGRKITVANNAILTIDSSHLFTCPDTALLWKGITLTSSGSTSGRIIVRNHSLIEDAEVAISAVNPLTPASGNIITVDSSIFNRNLQSVYIENYRPYVAADSGYAFSFKNSVFTSRQLKQPGNGYPNSWPNVMTLKTYTSNGVYAPYAIDKDYTKVFAKNGATVEAGIKLKAVGYTSGTTYRDIIIGGGLDTLKANLFDNISTGVYAELCNLNVKNSIFLNMYPKTDIILPFPGTPPGPQYKGCGVYATADGSYRLRLQVKDYVAVNSIPINKFFDCRYAVQASGFYQTEINRCRISSSQNQASPGTFFYGMLVSAGSNYNKFSINLNDMSNLKEGIIAYCNTSEQFVVATINTNTLTAVNPRLPSGTSGTGQYINQAIRLESNTPILFEDGILREAAVRYNTIKDVYNGIYVNNMKVIKAEVEGNSGMTIKPLPGPAAVQYGIAVLNSANTSVQSNSISSDGATAIRNSETIRAYYAAFNTNPSFCSNSCNYIGRGFEFAQTRSQMGTRWTLNSMNYGLRGFILGSDIGHQSFMYDYFTGSPGKFYGAGGNNWTGYGASNPHTTGINDRLPINSILFINSALPAAENPTANLSMPAVAPADRRYQYSVSIALSQFGTNCAGPFYPRFDGPTVLSPTGPVKMLAVAVIGDELGYGNEGKVDQWMSQLALYETGKLLPGLTDTFPIFNTFMNAASFSRFKWITDMQYALATENVGVAQSLLNSTPQTLGRVVIDPNVVITDYSEADYIVENYRNYFGLYIKKLNGVLDSPDLVSLGTLAHLCPATNGAVVYDARALYNSLTGLPLSYNDDDCQTNGSSSYKMGATKENEAAIQDYSLSPNPNNGNFTIRQRIAENKIVAVKVYNAVGSVVFQKQANFNNGSFVANIGNVVPGLYLVCIEENGKRTACLRFTVL